MSPPRQPSRDPRLNRGPPGPSSTPLRPTPIKTQDNNSKIPFVQGISDLVNSAVKTSSVQAEKDTLKKGQELAQGLLQKAQGQKAFPSLIEYFQQASDEHRAKLGRLEETSRDLRSQIEQHERDLNNQWTTSIFSTTRIDEKRLQDEVKAAKDEAEAAKKDAAQAKAEVSRLTESNQSMEKMLEDFRERLEKMERASTGRTADVKYLLETSTKLGAAFNKLDSGELSVEVTNKLCQNVTARLQPQIEGVKHLNTKLDARVAKVEEEIAPLKALPSKVDEIGDLVQEHAKKLTQSNVDKTVKLYKQINSVVPRLQDMTSRLEKVEAMAPRLETVEAMGPRLETVEVKLNQSNNSVAVPNGSSLSKTGMPLERLREFATKQELQKFIDFQKDKDFDVYDELTKVQSSVGDVQKQLDTLKDEHSQRSSQVVALQADSTKFSEQIAAAKAETTRISDDMKHLAPMTALQQLWGTMNTFHQNLEGCRVGLHSLETRYNSLSTEPVVKSMVVAMQEMYPSAGQLTDQVAQLRQRLEEELPTLKQRMDTLSETENDHFNQWQHTAAQRLDDINRLRNDHTNLNHTLTPLWERYAAERKLPSEDDVKNLSTELGLLREKLASLASQTSEIKTQSNLCKEGHGKNYGELAEKIQTMTAELQGLKDAFKEMKSTNKDNSRIVKDLMGQVDKLGDGLTEITSTNTGNSAVTTLETELKKLGDKSLELMSTNTGNSETLKALETELKKLGHELAEVKSSNLENFKSHDKDLKTLSTNIDDVENRVLETLEKKLTDTLSEALQSNASQPIESQPENELSAAVLPRSESPVETPRSTVENGSLLPKKKQKKRLRPSASEDERSSLPCGSSNLVSSPQLSTQETPVEGNRRKKRKKKGDARAEARKEDAILIEDD
ncbi:predicted protein [Aspergillus terreus NIH2624]|uniref:Paramyosin n=1 Tax=Aspergillus terreus (strain NIH 2624 / FGSC A1156) TaxID=341663 RepID=Q0CN84_ASPTN|nr:uncharacterized protein ATEG_04850 [Aspergillus terreus NIH2624]EAU35297.1 predicted protein [Aspergillus terreus NIH2624]